MGLGRENATEYIPDLDRKIFFQKYFKISYYLFKKIVCLQYTKWPSTNRPSFAAAVQVVRLTSATNERVVM